MRTADHIREFTRVLRAAGTAERAAGEKRYLKSDLDFLGTPVPIIRRTAKEFHRDHPHLERAAVVALVRALWRTRYHELRMVGIGLLERYVRILRAGDLAVVEALLRASNTWAQVDWLAVSVAGDLVERYRSTVRVLRRWARDDNFWVRRSALLALLRSLRRGEGDFALFTELAATMVGEREFFIRKAIGWVLREVSKKRPQLAYEFLRAHIDVVSGLTLREGAKYLPPTRRDTLMRRYRSR